MKPSSKTILRWIWFFVLFAFSSSIGWMDWYYWSVRGRYLTQQGLGLARAYARDFEEQHGILPSNENLIPYAEKRFQEDLRIMDFWPGGDVFVWKENNRPE